MQDVPEVIENQIWIGVTWREAFVVPFIPGTVPAWSDACFEPVAWPNSSQPRSDGDQGWCIVRSPATDADGWVYGTAFDHLREDRPGGRASKRANDRVRSRLWRRLEGSQEAGQQQQVTACRDTSSNGASTAAASPTAAAAALGASAASASKAAWFGAVHAVQTSMPGAVKRASFAGMVNTFLKLVKDAAARHNTVMITPDITGWFFVISTHSEELKKQQLGQLQQLVWFSREAQLQGAMKQGGLGTNPPGVVLKGAAAALAALEASKQQQQQQQQQQQSTPPAGAAGQGEPASATGSHDSVQTSTAGGSGAAAALSCAGSSDSIYGGAGSSSSSRSGSSSLSAVAAAVGSQHVLKGRPFPGLKMHIGSSTSSSNSRTSSSHSSQQRQEAASGSSTATAAPAAATAATAATAGGGGGPAGVQLHVAQLSMLDDLLAGAQYSQAAYGYVAAAGHLSNLGNAIKMLATLPHFNAITGASLEANIRAMHTLAGFCPQDVLLAAWHNDTFRPCHYVAIDVKRGSIVLGVRGSLELGDLETDVTAAPLPFEFQGVAGWVHEGLLAAAAYVVSNTVDALAEAAQRCPGWPLVVAGHSLGGGVAALVTLLLQQPGAAPRGISGVRCITIGPPAVLSQELCGLCEEYVTSIVLGADPIPRLSTFSVESLLLDLVTASLSHRVTSQLAATTSSVAASTAGAINSLAAGLTRLANTATTNMVSNVNSMKSSLASFKALPGFQLTPADFGLGGASLPGLTGPTAADGGGSSRGAGAAGVGELYTAGTGSVELTLRLQQQWQEQAEREGSSGGLKQVHAMLQDDMQYSRASLDAQRDQQQQQQQQQQRQDATAQTAADSAVGQTAQLSGPCLAAPPAAAKQFAGTAALSGAGQQQHEQPELQQQHGVAPAAGAAARVPLWQKETSSIKPGGPKLVSGGPAAANIMIFPKHDDVSIITGIQEAWAGLRPHGASTAAVPPAASSSDGRRCVGDSSSRGSDSGTARQPAAAAAVAAVAPAASKPVRSHSSSDRSSRSGGRSRVTPFAIEQPSGTDVAAGGRPPSAAAGGPPNGISETTGSSSSMKRCTSEPSLQQWASDGLQGLGEPSWVTLSRSSDGGSGRRGQQQQQGGGAGQDGSSGSSGEGGAVGDSTVHALESDLKKTARLYPPGRILWLLSEELVGPAAHQLMTAVAAHLTPQAAVAAAAAAAAAVNSPKKQTRASSSSGSRLEPPSQAHMDMPSSVMGPGSSSSGGSSSKPVLRTRPKQQQAPTVPRPQQQQQQQLSPLSSKTAARDAATAHAVAAASAKHILQDVHSLEARRAAAAALQAAQHEHRPLHLNESTSPQEAAAQLEQQLRDQQQDLAAAEASVPDESSSPAAAGGNSSSSIQTAGKPLLRTLRTTPAVDSSSVQMTAKPPAAAGTPPVAEPSTPAPGSTATPTTATAAAAAAAATPTATANRSSSGPMEVDGSAAGRAAGFGWPSSWGSAGAALNPEDLPQELWDLVQILGEPCDAASALAIGYKKQVLLQHFWQQRQREASAAVAAAAGAGRPGSSSGGGSSSGRRGRASSDSHLMKFEDMIRAVDDLGAGADGSTSAAAAAAAAGNGSSSAAGVVPQVELVDHSWWGTLSSLGAGGSNSNSKAPQQSPEAVASAAGSSQPLTAAAAAAAVKAEPGSSGQPRGMSVGPSHQLLDSVSLGGGGTDEAASPVAAAAAADRLNTGPQQQQQQQQDDAELQLPIVQESPDDYILWAAQQAAQAAQQHHQQLEQQQAAAAASKPQLSLPELAAERLVELAQLPERIAESFVGLKLGGGAGNSSSSRDGGEDVCAELGPGAAAGLASLCAPVLTPAGAADGPAAATTTSGSRLPPVVVLPERDVFSRLLLHRTAVLDHLPSNYVKALTDLREAFSKLPHSPRQQQ